MKEENKEILNILENSYPDATTELNYSNPFELLIATILSAQCTDKQVNKVTEVLFKKYPTAYHIAKLTPEELGKEVKSCGFYKTKAENIVKTCNILISQYAGKVPETMEELTKLPGVGRKTANVVLSNAFGHPAIAVDTHVFRVSNRIGLANSEDVLKTEHQLMEAIPKERWSKAHHWLILHGRRVCKARKPLCDKCELTKHCRYFAEQ